MVWVVFGAFININPACTRGPLVHDEFDSEVHTLCVRITVLVDSCDFHDPGLLDVNPNRKPNTNVPVDDKYVTEGEIQSLNSVCVMVDIVFHVVRSWLSHRYAEPWSSGKSACNIVRAAFVHCSKFRE